MFKTIIAAVDGTAGGRDAAVLARRIADLGGAELRLAHVYSTDLFATRASNADFDRTVQDDAEALLERERSALGIEGQTIAVGDKSVARGLQHLAGREGADLIVVGSCHRGAAGRILIGNNAQATLQGAPCAVAVAPRAFAESASAFASIGVGYNGSPESRDALDAAVELVRAGGGKLHLLDVVKETVPMSVGFPYAATYDGTVATEEHRVDAQAIVDSALRDLDVPADGEVVVGLPTEEVSRLSERVDLVVVGSRGFGPVRSLLLGSTSHYLVNHAHCPVVVLPRGERVAGDEPVVLAAAGG